LEADQSIVRQKICSNEKVNVINQSRKNMLDTTSIYIKNKLEALGLSQGLLIVFSGNRISQARLAQALSGGSPLRNEDGLVFRRLLGELDELAASSLTPVNWKETERIQEALRIRRDARKVMEEV
jgi:hypothetical protein